MRKVGEVRAEVHKKEITLNNKDREIINILTINSRTPLSQIARALKTSTEVISYRYNSLRKNNVITDVFTVIDPKILGIHRYILYLQFHALSQNRMNLIIEDFLKNKYVNWIIETGGKWEIILMFETLYEENYEFKGKLRDSSYALDEKDIILLKNIHEDSRMSLTDLGKKLKLSRDAVNYRIKNLIKTGIIKDFILRLNYHLLDYQYTTIMIKFRTISQKRKEEFLQYLYNDERFYSLMGQIGTWDLSLMMFFTNAKDLRDFLISIKEKFSDVIHSHDSVIHFDQHYYTYLCDGVVEELVAQTKSSEGLSL